MIIFYVEHLGSLH